MPALPQGSTTGHTTVAVRHPDGDLYVHESTAKDSYWPVNGIQATPYVAHVPCVLTVGSCVTLDGTASCPLSRFKQWIAQAKAASFNVVHAPLSDENRAKFNTTAALEFFEQGATRVTDAPTRCIACSVRHLTAVAPRAAHRAQLRA